MVAPNLTDIADALSNTRVPAMQLLELAGSDVFEASEFVTWARAYLEKNMEYYASDKNGELKAFTSVVTLAVNVGLIAGRQRIEVSTS